MNQHFKFSLFFSAAIVAVFTALSSQGHAQVIVDEQFDGNAVDSSIFTTDNGSTLFGRVRLNSQFPPVQNGTLRLRLQSFNPIDPGSRFWADEIRTRRTFAPNANFGFSFDTRARFVDDATNPLNTGVIGGIFLFGVDANFPAVNERDEIDFELLSNNPVNSISTNIFNDDDFEQPGNFQITTFPGLDLTEFNDYRIEIQLDRTRFFVNDILIREDTSNLALEPQDFRLNINTQGDSFAAAFSDAIQPTANPADNEIFIMEVDSLVIRQLPAPGVTTTSIVIADFAANDTASTFESFDGRGSFSNDGYSITLPPTGGSNFGILAEFGGNLVTQGVFIDENTQLLVEATVGPNNNTDFLVVAVREDSGEFFSVMVPTADLADDGQAVVNLSDFFFNDDGNNDGIISGTAVEASFQSPFGSGNAVDFTVQRISVLTTVVDDTDLLGDFDFDGDVDADDIDFYFGQIGLTSADAGFNSDLDLDGNGTINLDDHAIHITTLVQTSNGLVGTFIGDFDLDGTVDVLGDAFVLISNLGSPNVVGYAGGDTNADGLVDVLGDAFVLISNLGSSNTP